MYTVFISESAGKEISRLPKAMIHRVLGKIESLSGEPRPSGCKKLAGFKDLWRVGIGNYRIIYRIEDEIQVLTVNKVSHRKDAYK